MPAGGTMTREITINADLTTLGKYLGIVDVRGFDDLHHRFERLEGSSTLTGVVSYRLSLGLDDEGSAPVAITMDGTIGTVDVSTAAYVRLFVTTAQSGYTGNIHLYARERAIT